jgi:hypothetical protein
VVGWHCGGVRDTDGDRISKGQHAWLISKSVSKPALLRSVREPEHVFIFGDS